MNFRILQGVRGALRSPGKFILTTLNALYPLSHSVEELRNVTTHEVRSLDGVFDLLTFRKTSVFEIIDDNGVKKSLTGNERWYAPAELSWLLASLGFTKIDMYGCTPGQFIRNTVLTPAHFEMLVIANC